MHSTDPTLSNEANHLIQLANTLAGQQQAPAGSASLLLALFSADNLAQHYLRENNVEPERLFSCVDNHSFEPEEVYQSIWQTSQALAQHEPEAVVTSMHLLAGLLRFHNHSLAIDALRQAGYDTTRLRNSLISQLTRRARRNQVTTAATQRNPQAWNEAVHGNQAMHPGPPAPEGFSPEPMTGSGPHPLLAPNPYLPQPSPTMPAALMPPPARAPVAPRPAAPRPTKARQGTPTTRRPNPKRPTKARPGKTTRRNAPKGDEPLAEKLKGRFGSRKAQHRRQELTKPSMKDLANSLFADGIPKPKSSPEDAKEARKTRKGPGKAPEEIPATGEEQDSKDTKKTAKKTTKPEKKASQPAIRTREPRSQGQARPEPVKDGLRRVMPATLGRAQKRKLEDKYSLSEKKFPTLCKLGRNLSLEAVQGRFDGLIGRGVEVSQLIDVLNKRRSNNPLLVGPPGVGKTAIVEGLALALVGEEGQQAGLGERVLVELEMGRLLSGTQLRGSFAERLGQIKDEVLQAEGHVIIFLDELHTWIGAGASGDGGADAAGELKSALARGRFPCIGATTLDEYKRFIEADPAFRRRFQVVEVDEPSEEVALEILRGLRSVYEDHHKVTIGEEALQAAVQFSQRYIPEQQQPDKAIGVLDLAGSRARRGEEKRVTREVVAQVVSDQTGVPVDKLLMRDKDRFLRMEENLSAGLIGHRHVIRRVSQVIRRNYAGFQSGRPIGSFLFLGPTGVGKTEMVKVLADFLFKDRNAIVRLDMSEFREGHAVSRLIGAPPGYVGYDQGGQLTEAVRRKPYQIVLLDEVEKAHPEVLNVLLQLLDDGRLTDGKGRTVDFSNTVVIMTSNLGSEVFARGIDDQQSRPRIGFGPLSAGMSGLAGDVPQDLSPEVEQHVLGVTRAALSPELWNRIEERLVFGALTRLEVQAIAQLQFQDSARRLAAERDVYMEASPGLFAWLASQGGYDPQLGARPMRQTLQRLIEARVSEMILKGEVSPGDHIMIRVTDGQAHFQVMDQ